jgi:hypothetical protein
MLIDNYGSCYRCGASWRTAKHHNTQYQPGLGCFPLCEDCWGVLTPAERLPFYRTLFQEWESYGPMSEAERAVYNWGDIERAVLEGK